MLGAKVVNRGICRFRGISHTCMPDSDQNNRLSREKQLFQPRAEFLPAG